MDLGLYLQVSWVQACMDHLRGSRSDWVGLSARPNQLLEAVIAQALFADFRECGAVHLPPGIQVSWPTEHSTESIERQKWTAGFPSFLTRGSRPTCATPLDPDVAQPGLAGQACATDRRSGGHGCRSQGQVSSGW